MRRASAAFGAFACAIAVALGAYAAHAADGRARERLALAAAFAFGNGLGLLLLRARAGRLADASRACLAIGIALFCGSLAGAALFAIPTALAPFGGSLLILGWLLAAADQLRKD